MTGERANRPVWWHAFAAGLVHSALLVLAFPPFSLWGFALVAPAPLVWIALRGGDAPKRVALLAALGVVPFWAFEQRWAFVSTSVGFFPMLAMLAAYSGLFVWTLARLTRRFQRLPLWIVVPTVWSGVELFRGAVLWGGYPWFLGAHPLIDAPLLPQAAAVVGAYGVSVLLAGLIGAAFELPRCRVRAGVSFGVIAVTWLGLAWIGGESGAAASHSSEGPVHVAVVQTNVPQSNRTGWDAVERLEALDALTRLSRAAAAESPDLIVWPETMFPGLAIESDAVEALREHSIAGFSRVPFGEAAARVDALETGDELPVGVGPGAEGGQAIALPYAEVADYVLNLQSGLGVPILLGAQGRDGLRITPHDDGSVEIDSDASFNSVFLLRAGRLDPRRYDKVHLTPFGEVMPYISNWAWLEETLLRIGLGASGMRFDLDAGSLPVVFDVHDVRIATPICFEATMPGVVRRLVFAHGARRAGVIVQLTNDGWFYGTDAGREQHLQGVRWRAVELATPIVRAANTGVSCSIDAGGRVLDRLPPRAEGVLQARVAPAGGVTLFARTGDAVGWGCFCVCVLLLAASFAPARQQSSDRAENPPGGSRPPSDPETRR